MLRMRTALCDGALGRSYKPWHQLWDLPNQATLEQETAELKKAKRLRVSTDRERQYIAALDAFYQHRDREFKVRATAYSRRMEQLYGKYPDDHEAGVLYTLSLMASEPEHRKTLIRI